MPRDRWRGRPADVLVALLLLLVVVGILVVVTAGVDATGDAARSSSDRSTPRANPPLQLPAASGDCVGLTETPRAGNDEHVPSPTLTIPVMPGARAPGAYVLHLTHAAGAWRVASLDPATPDHADQDPTDTLTLTVVVPWRDLERDYRWLKVVLR